MLVLHLPATLGMSYMGYCEVLFLSIRKLELGINY